MPHARMEMHKALIEANNYFNGNYDADMVLASTSLEAVASAVGESVPGAVQRLDPAIGETLLGALKAAAADGARPVYLSWRHGPIQRVEVTAPATEGLPLDIRIESRYDEDGLGPPGSTS